MMSIFFAFQNLSPSALGLVDNIMMDFCDLLPNTSHALERLLDVCPQFLNQLLPCVFSYLCIKGMVVLTGHISKNLTGRLEMCKRIAGVRISWDRKLKC